MKKLSILFTTLAICLGTTAWGASTVCYPLTGANAGLTGCPNATPDDYYCNDDFCNTCVTTTTTLGGYVATTVNEPGYFCNGTTKFQCSCSMGAPTYKCASGYYGTANSSGTSGCTKCPDNATCPGGNSSTFTCNSGYYKYNNICAPCPSSGSYATCSGSTLTCAKGYYRNLIIGTSSNYYGCTRCPQAEDDEGNLLYTTNAYLSPFYTTTSSTGATSSAACSIPTGGTAYGTDSTGAFTYDTDDGTKTYTSCTSTTQFLSSGTCKTCPSNSSASSATATSCTCNSGYTTTGLAGGSTTTTSTACQAVDTTACIKITVNDYCTSVTNSPSTLYKRAGKTGWYSDSGCSTTFSGPINFSCGSSHVLRGVFSSNKGDVTADASGDSAALLFNNNGELTTAGESWAPTAATTIYGSWARNCSAGTGATCSRTIDSTTGAVDYTTACEDGYGNITNNNAYNPSCTADETEPTTGTCPAGTYYYDGSESCDECDAGYYCPGVTYTVGGDTFQGRESCGYSTMQKTATCPDNAHDCYYICDTGTSPTGSDSASDCYSCSSGCNCGTTLYFTCDDGYVKSGNTCVAATSVTTCAAGTYFYKSNSTATANCNTCPKGCYCPGVSQFFETVGMFGNYPCPAGTYNSTTGATSVDACLPCTVTLPTNGVYTEGAYYNTFGSAGTASCAICPGNMGSSSSCYVSSAAITCQPGTFAALNTSTYGSWLQPCFPCPNGYYCPGGTYTIADAVNIIFDGSNKSTATYWIGAGAELCPTSGGFVAHTTFDQATNTPAAITDCFIPAGYSESDDTGNWEYGQACYYTE